MAVARFRRDPKAVLDQMLIALGARTQAEPVFAELNRGLVAVGEAMGQLSAQEGSEGVEARSPVMKYRL